MQRRRELHRDRAAAPAAAGARLAEYAPRGRASRRRRGLRKRDPPLRAPLRSSAGETCASSTQSPRRRVLSMRTRESGSPCDRAATRRTSATRRALPRTRRPRTARCADTQPRDGRDRDTSAQMTATAIHGFTCTLAFGLSPNISGA
jgi:hypothetical protein